MLWIWENIVWFFLRNSASSIHWLSSSIFTCLSFVVCRLSRIVTSHLISTIWGFRRYIPYIFCEDMILATCQCQHILCIQWILFITELSPVYCCLVWIFTSHISIFQYLETAHPSWAPLTRFSFLQYLVFNIWPKLGSLNQVSLQYLDIWQEICMNMKNQAVLNF